MKIVLVALNSKYIHASLAPWYLKAACGDEFGEITVLEKTINDNIDAILSEIYLLKPDVAGFSCYIWNIKQVMKICENLKKLLPKIRIVLGGPEISYDAEEIIDKNSFIDYIIIGEGEYSFKALLEATIYSDKITGHDSMTDFNKKSDKHNLLKISGLVYRDNGKIWSNGQYTLIEKLDDLPSPYTEKMLASTSGRIMYFESSRGCPFSCSYCLSSTFNGVRHFSLDRVKKDLTKLIENNVKLIKFVDRTFNCSRVHAKEIFKFVIAHGNNSVFHFEAAADLFDDEMLQILSNAPQGRIQLEIGIQSTNTRTLIEVDRKSNLEKAFNSIRNIKKIGNIHLHLDLIAGLPYENFDSFANSFNQVYNLKPHNLQLGFLKLLKGSKIRKESEKHGYIYRNYPPYEVLYNSFINFDQIIILKGIEEILELYYNSGRFAKTLEYVIDKHFCTPFDFYLNFYLYSQSKGLFKNSVSSRSLYPLFLDYLKNMVIKDELALINNLLKLDFLASDRSKYLPEGLERNLIYNFKEQGFDFLKNEENIKKYLPGFIGQSAKQIYKDVHFEYFSYDVFEIDEKLPVNKKDTLILFDYTSRNSVTNLYAYFKIF